MSTWYLIFVAVAVFLLSARQASAVPPPDFIFNVTTQIAQFFSISVLLFSAVGSAVFRTVRQHLQSRQRLIFWVIAGVAMLTVSGVGAWLYGRYAQDRSLQEWLAMSERYGRSATATADNLDLLVLGDATTTVPTEVPEDGVALFIRRYYAALADRRLEEAYAMSKQSVPFETFRGWYVSTTAVGIDAMQRIDEDSTSLELTLAEGEVSTRYGVVMDLRLDEQGKPLQVERSFVRTLGQDRGAPATPSDRSVPLTIPRAEFMALNDAPGASFLVLDAREDIEFEYGRFPDATHIRFADLKAGRWVELPTDRPVIVFCWSGLRGQAVAEFLRTKQIPARAVEGGADGWVADKGAWVGDISFQGVYAADRYIRLVPQDWLDDGAMLVDTRSPASYAEWHIPGSVNIPLMSTPTIDLERVFSQVPANSKVITVCDEFTNCFDAKLTGVELERRGHTFLGRFNEPWRLRE